MPIKSKITTYSKIFEKLGSYHAFLAKYEDEYAIELSSAEEAIIEYLSRKIAKGKRIHELEMLQDLRLAKTNVMNFFKTSLINVE